MESPVIAPSPAPQLDNPHDALELEFQPAPRGPRVSIFTGRPMIFLWLAGIVLTVLRLAAFKVGKIQIGFEVSLQVLAAAIGGAACFWAFYSERDKWLVRARIAWACIGASALFCA
ncbi:hypothetical protein EON80_16945, partial [bacterium]